MHPAARLIRAVARRTISPAADAICALFLFGSRARMVPPRALMHDGVQDVAAFKANGEEFFRHYLDLCALQPGDTMLDIGCGIGRKTIPLTRYLDRNGRYEGFDIVPSGIDWCTRRITRTHPNFRFQLADVFNARYNPTGRYRASEYRFPFADDTFDVVVLGSVFTHMLPEDVAHYLSEIVRVMKPDGRCLISFFLLDAEALALVAAKKSTLDFAHALGECRTTNAAVPEEAIAYDEALVVRMFAERGLRIVPPIHHGSWCGRTTFLSYQDLIVATKA